MKEIEIESVISEMMDIRAYIILNNLSLVLFKITTLFCISEQKINACFCCQFSDREERLLFLFDNGQYQARWIR